MTTDKIYDNLNLMKGETQLQLILLRKILRNVLFLGSNLRNLTKNFLRDQKEKCHEKTLKVITFKG